MIEIRSKKRGGRAFYRCSNYANEAIKCDFKLWQKPIPEACPDCGAPFLVFGGTRTKPAIVCANKECGYKRPVGEAVSSGAGQPAIGTEAQAPSIVV
jgi:DNA topoisomerase-1